MTPSLLDLKFIGIIACIGLLRAFCPVRYYALFGLLATSALMWFAAPSTLLLLGGITLFLLYPLHRLNRAAEERAWPRQWTRFIVPSGVVVLVGGLVGFKLYRHIDLPFAASEMLYAQLSGLFGFSYFIFRAIGFLHIQSILRFKESTPIPLLYFTLFPTTLTSGPIQKYQDFREQINKPERLSFKLLGEAGYRITRGFFRKLVLAAGLDSGVQTLFSLGEFNIWLCIVLVAILYLFFYFDFAGYSDIAIGFGLLLGIRVPENFRNPFQATTIAEFWRNWHITLADWLRDQVFIPLGGMHASRKRAAFLALGIMILCGMWHGITWSFLAWGVWHGLILYVEAMIGVKPIPPSKRNGLKYWLRVLWTNGRVAIGAVFFLPVESIQRLSSGLTKWTF